MQYSFEPIPSALESFLASLKPAMALLTAVELFIPLAGFVVLAITVFRHIKRQRHVETNSGLRNSRQTLWKEVKNGEAIVAVIAVLVVVITLPMLIPE